MRALADRRPSLQMGQAGVLFMMISLGLLLFGVLMIYSASSIMALTAEAYNYNPAYFATRQLAFAAIGLAIAVFLWRVDYHVWAQRFLLPLWLGTLALLAIVFTPIAGADAYGATRWIAIGPLHLQPSEFAKATILIVAASYCQQYFVDGDLTLEEFAMRGGGLVFAPLAFIMKQPDKGTVLVVGITLLVVLFLAGVPWKYLVAVAAIGFAIILYASLSDDYSRARIEIRSDPWKDPYGDGYQLIQGYYAFGSGGLLGVGLGMSRQKYSYLPMAHNDFIFAVIGEELGFVGAVLVLLTFFALVWAGFQIARQAPDLIGRIIAAGAVTMLGLQLLVNVSGVLGIIPLSGKPIPFLSYGGSSIMSTLMLVGLVLSVDRESQQGGRGRRPVGFEVYEPMGAEGRSLRVISGGGGDRRRRTPDDLRSERAFEQTYGQGRLTVNGNGSRRIDLGPSARDRLRRR